MSGVNDFLLVGLTYAVAEGKLTPEEAAFANEIIQDRTRLKDPMVLARVMALIDKHRHGGSTPAPASGDLADQVAKLKIDVTMHAGLLGDALKRIVALEGAIMDLLASDAPADGT